MTALDFLYIALAVSALSVAVFLNIVLYNVVLSLRTLRNTLENIHSYTKDAVGIKDKLKLNALKGVSKLLSFIPRPR